MRTLLICCIGFVAAISATAETAPKLLPFQGRLTDQNGVAVSNGVRLVQFKIFEVPSGGSPVWGGELHRITVNGGLVNVLLGTKTTLPSTNSSGGQFFDQQLYLEITVDVSGPNGPNDNAITAADPPMLPRQAILPVVFAKEAADSRKLAGEDWTPVFGVNNPNLPIPASKLAEGSLPGSKIAPNSITSSQLALGTVTGGNIAASTISAANIIPATIDLASLAQRVVEALNPAGAILAFGGTNQPPPGWVLCDGRELNRDDYPALFAAIGTAWGYGNNGPTFNVPDMRGLFLRGVDGFAGMDPDKTTRLASRPGGLTGNNVGSFQNSTNLSHQHNWAGMYVSGVSKHPNSGLSIFSNGFDSQGGPNVDDAIGNAFANNDYRGSIRPNGGGESRPKNAYVNYIIKY